MIYLTYAKYLVDYKIEIRFNSDETAVVDLSPYLSGEIFAPLRSIDYFKTVILNKDIDTISWENGADFAPEFLLEIAKKMSSVEFENADIDPPVL